MKNAFKLLFGLSAALLTTLATPVQADSIENVPYFGEELTNTYWDGTTQGWDHCNPSFRGNCGRLFVKGEWLYGIMYERGLNTFLPATAFTSTSIDTADSDLFVYTSTTRQHRFHFDWRNGFRLGIGYTLAPSETLFGEWGLAFDWTHFKGRGHESSHAPALETFGKAHIDYDVLDGYLFSPSTTAFGCVSLNLFAGVKAARIEDKVRTNFNSNSTASNTDAGGTTVFNTLNSNTSVHAQTSFKGIGPELGIHANWDLGNGLSIYGKIDGAFVYSNYRTRLNAVTTSVSKEPNGDVDTTLGIESSKSTDRDCQPVLDLFFGVRWLKHLCISPQGADLMVQLGYEHHHWYNHRDNPSHGDLCFDGFSFGASLNF